MAHINALIAAYTCAQAYATAAADVKHFKQVLDGGYLAWRKETGNHDFLKRGSDDWNAMMIATEAEYRDLTNAKARERRAKAKLLTAVMEGA